MKRVSQSEIARRLGIHQSTVSCILNGYNFEKFDPNTRKRVLDLAQQLGYRRSRQALLLRGEPSRTIAVLDFRTTSRTAHLRLQAICRAIWERNYLPLPLEANWFTYSADPVCDLLLDQHVEGVIFSGFSDPFESYHLQSLKKANIALEICMGVCPPGVNHTDVDRSNAIADLTRRLIQSGRRQPALLLRESTSLKNMEVRPDNQFIQGFREALHSLGLDDATFPIWVFPQIAVSDKNLMLQGKEAMAELMKAHPSVDAVICERDQVAAGAIAWCREHAKSVPESLAVIGFNDEEFCEFLSPTLSTFSIPTEAMAQSLVARLVQRIESKHSPEPSQQKPVRDLLGCRYIQRASCGLP